LANAGGRIARVAERGTSLRRGLDVLAALGSDAAVAEGGLGVTQIAALTGQEKSQVSRTLAVLAERGLAERAPGSPAYRLGWGCFALAARAGEPRLLAEAARILSVLVEEVGEAAHLSALRGREVLTLLTEAPAHAIVARSWAGRTIPVFCTSSGRALLLDFDRDELLALLGSEPFAPRGPNTPRDVAELERRIDRARHAGYAVADEESEPGLVGVAAPVRDFSGSVIAALNVSAPKFRLGTRLHPTGEIVRGAARELSSLLGAPGSAAPPETPPAGSRLRADTFRQAAAAIPWPLAAPARNRAGAPVDNK
jgi:IclR family KDG regulon transcriptional repressor